MDIVFTSVQSINGAIPSPQLQLLCVSSCSLGKKAVGLSFTAFHSERHGVALVVSYVFRSVYTERFLVRCYHRYKMFYCHQNNCEKMGPSPILSIIHTITIGTMLKALRVNRPLGRNHIVK